MPQTVPVKIGRGRSVVDGTVEWFNEEEGWGALAAPEVPGGCFVHYSSILASG
jgi:CspA family cold shock protein